ncbi:MAG: hypothetical protein RQ824_05300 [bacterium]|nr:hypothetical protein [bacterium]
MKDTMTLSNIETILNFNHPSSQQKYSRVFNNLKERLPAIAESMSEVHMDYMRGDTAEYSVSRLENVSGEMKEITYFIYFVKDNNGLWRIESF